MHHCSYRDLSASCTPGFWHLRMCKYTLPDESFAEVLSHCTRSWQIRFALFSLVLNSQTFTVNYMYYICTHCRIEASRAWMTSSAVASVRLDMMLHDGMYWCRRCSLQIWLMKNLIIMWCYCSIGHCLLSLCWLIYLRQRRRWMWLPAMFVCLSVSKITQKRVHGFRWHFACRQV